MLDPNEADIPADWRIIRIGDLGRVVTGRTPGGDRPDAFGGAVPFVTPSDFDGRAVIMQTARCLSSAGAEMLARTLLPSGSVAVTCIGSQLGKAAYLPQTSVTNQQINTICPTNGVDGRFIYYLLSREQAFLQDLAGGSAVPIINKSLFERIRVALPPTDEQRAIAEVLGGLDDQIELNRQMNQTLEEMASSLFKSWFVDFDPVVANSVGRVPFGMDAGTASLFPDGFDGELPAGWVQTSVEDVIAELFDGPHATPPEAPEGPLFLGIGNMSGTKLDLSLVRHISEADWPKWTRRVTPAHGDIVFTYEAALGRFALIPEGLRCCLGRRMALVRPRSVEQTPFLFHQFISPQFQELIAARAWLGSTVDRTPLTEFPRYPILWPGEAVVRAFGRSAGDYWQLIHCNEDESRTLAALRDLLLPKLLSGEIRLKQAEKAVAAVL